MGHVKLDYGLRFQPSDHTIRMTQVRVRELTLASGSNNLRGAAQRIGGLVAENALENLVLYRMKPAQADEMDRLEPGGLADHGDAAGPAHDGRAAAELETL